MMFCLVVRKFVALLGCLAVLLLFVGCAPKQEARKRFFWPPLVDEPKIEFVGFVQSDYDVKKRHVGILEEAILGREIPTILFDYPYDVVSSASDVVYVTEPSANLVHFVDLNSGNIDTLKNNEGETYRFELPLGIDCDKKGNIYVADSLAGKILVFGSDRVLKEKWGNANVSRPVNLAVDNKNSRLYVVEPEQHKILILSLVDGRYIGALGDRGLEAGQFNYPLDADVDSAGNLYVLDSLNARVQKFDPSGAFLIAFGERGTELGSFQRPKGLSVGPFDNIYVSDSLTHRFVVFDDEGNFLLTVGGQYAMANGIVPGGFNLPQGIDVGPSGQIWVVDALNRVLHKYQLLTSEYLEKDPILPGQAVNPFEGDLN